VGRKIFIGGLGVALAVLAPTSLGGGGTMQALDCPVNDLATVCGAVDLVVATVCNQPLPAVPTIGFVTIDVEGGAPVQCPDI
jgi:hypothetical protein